MNIGKLFKDKKRPIISEVETVLVLHGIILLDLGIQFSQFLLLLKDITVLLLKISLWF